MLLALVLAAGLDGKADDWPQWMGPRRDDVWRETGVLDRFGPAGPKVLWRAKIRSGFAGPAVADGRVYVTDYLTAEDVHKLSTYTRARRIDGKERVLCLDAKDGKQLWKHEYDCPYEVSYPTGPRCTPTVAGGKVYTLGTEGNLCCLGAKDGKVLWSKDFKKDYGAKTALWGFCGHPLVDGKKLICTVGGKGAAVVAFDKDTGAELWKSLDVKELGYSPPTIITAGGKRQLIVWTAEAIHSLDPETGKPYWAVGLVPDYGMAIMAPRQGGDYLFAGGIGYKAALLKLDREKPAAAVVWRGDAKTAVYPVNSTPLVEGDVLYGVNQPGQLIAVELKTGKRLWETLKPTTGGRPASSATAFLTRNGERHFLFNEKGELIIAKLSPGGYEELGRAALLKPTNPVSGRVVVWSHPAFANRCVFARNDGEIVCASLAK
jgi:outer membrane protein assembly factor BamB